MKNPYLEAWNASKGRTSPEWERYELCRKYAFAIPTEENIDSILEHTQGGIIELGAGTGYWAWMLSQKGAKIEAFDIAPPRNKSNRYKFADEYFHVNFGSTTALRTTTAETLLICWPPADSTFGREAIEQFRGKKHSKCLVYIGEEENGCTGEKSLYQELKNWNQVLVLDMPNWVGMYSKIKIFSKPKNI